MSMSIEKEIRLMNWEAVGLYKRWEKEKEKEYSLEVFIENNCSFQRNIFYYKGIIEDYGLYDFGMKIKVKRY